MFIVAVFIRIFTPSIVALAATSWVRLTNISGPVRFELLEDVGCCWAKFERRQTLEVRGANIRVATREDRKNSLSFP